MSQRALPECWGHRGASAAYPENTLASFEAAMRDGSEGIESDVHVSADNVVIMFHDPSLDRTTNGTGFIKQKNWYGPDGMERLRTRKEPCQSIPTFAETVALLMKPENRHVKFNVDVKATNDPTRLFTLMAATIESMPDWRTALAPRILLGVWHPRFLPAARAYLPHCRRAHIGVDPAIARRYFWDDCDAFSLLFGALTDAAGAKFMKECKAAGKQICVWTVNSPLQMAEAVRWQVDAILTDVPQTWLSMRGALQGDYDGQIARYGRMFLWTTPHYFWPMLRLRKQAAMARLEAVAGPFTEVEGAVAVGAVEPMSPPSPNLPEAAISPMLPVSAAVKVSA